MTIPLPPLPDDFNFKGPRKITASQLRAIQREAMRAAIEAASELVHTEYLDAFLFGTKDAATLQELERAIRNLEVEC